MKRRSFLGVGFASFLAACSRADEPAANDTTTASSETVSPSSVTQPTQPATSVASTVEPTPPGVDPLTPPPVVLPEDAFALGVASGEPDDRSVVVWTRLLGATDESVPIVWELSASEVFEGLVATGVVAVEAVHAHSVRVVATGLEPASHYWYRFLAGDLVSPKGRTRTMPAMGDKQPIALGVSSCQARSDGAWAAHRDLATARVDAVLWLGDYIYGEYRNLAEYRAAYVTYRSDPLLQRCHAAHPWFVFTDDHEVRNDYDASVDPKRRGAALKAWWEHIPTRLPPPDESGHLRIHRSFDLGGVARVVGLDVRQYADDTQLFGDEQWAAVGSDLDHGASRTIVASPVLMSGVRDLDGKPLLPYSIDAYPHERSRMAAALAAAPKPLIVSGDLHTTLVADFSADPLDRLETPVAVEIMAPAISSAFPEQYADLAPFLPLVNPQLREVTVANGWLKLDVSEVRVDAEFHLVDDVKDPDSAITTRIVTL